MRSADSGDAGFSRSINWMAHTQPGRTDFDAVVLHTDQNWFVLDSTWFEADLPTAIGDCGWLWHGGQRIPITRVDADGVHHLATTAAISPGERVSLGVDPHARSTRMRIAALQNLLRSVLAGTGDWQPGIRTTTRATLQHGWAAEPPSLDVVHADLLALIREDHHIWRITDDADGRVYWQVDGVATIEDTTLSVNHTGAIGAFSLRLADSGGRLCIFAEVLPA